MQYETFLMQPNTEPDFIFLKNTRTVRSLNIKINLYLSEVEGLEQPRLQICCLIPASRSQSHIQHLWPLQILIMCRGSTKRSNLQNPSVLPCILFPLYFAHLPLQNCTKHIQSFHFKVLTLNMRLFGMTIPCFRRMLN